MPQPYKDAISLCKAIMRNGFDAYVIGARLDESLQHGDAKEITVDIATDMDLEELMKLFPEVMHSQEPGVTGMLLQGGVLFYFTATGVVEATHPEAAVIRATPRLLRRMERADGLPHSLACPYIPKAGSAYDGFEDLGEGVVRLVGLPDETLKRNYLLGIRAFRFAANYGLPIDPNTWMAIVRSAQRILDYVSVSDIMDEWLKVEAENLCHFVRMLFESQIMHGLIPEVAALKRVIHIKNKNGQDESVLDHTIDVMSRYPEELPYDWYGTMACLFHDVGKLFTAEWVQDRWHFHQHHEVGARVTRKILGRLRFEPQDIDLICHLVRHHMRFSYMLTDKGIRRFKALDEYPRLIEMARADIKARGGEYTEFNHNMKMLERADVPEEMLEPLLNGNEIMDFTGLKPGPQVGHIREALMKAQVVGEVSSVPEAVEFVQSYARQHFKQGAGQKGRTR